MSSATNGTMSPAGGAAMGCSPCGINSCCASRDELKKTLTPLQFQITQEKGTERAFTGKYYKLKDDGIYSCVVCAEKLFSSDTKYESGSGWPAFYDVVDKKKVKLKHDLSHVGGNLLLLAMKPGLARTEVSCAKCQSHLGHVFDDGPKPTGKRFCINSAALDFEPSTSGGNDDTVTSPTTCTTNGQPLQQNGSSIDKMAAGDKPANPPAKLIHATAGVVSVSPKPNAAVTTKSLPSRQEHVSVV